MTKQEILARLKPVLSAELYSAIEAVFVSEEKLANAAKVFAEFMQPKATPFYTADYAAQQEMKYDAMRSNPHAIWDTKEA